MAFHLRALEAPIELHPLRSPSIWLKVYDLGSQRLSPQKNLKSDVDEGPDLRERERERDEQRRGVARVRRCSDYHQFQHIPLLRNRNWATRHAVIIAAVAASNCTAKNQPMGEHLKLRLGHTRAQRHAFPIKLRPRWGSKPFEISKLSSLSLAVGFPSNSRRLLHKARNKAIGKHKRWWAVIRKITKGAKRKKERWKEFQKI